MPIYCYECRNQHKFEEFNSIANRHSASCPVCGEPGGVRIASPSIRIAEPITFLQELPNREGYKVLGWKADSGIAPKRGQPYPMEV